MFQHQDEYLGSLCYFFLYLMLMSNIYFFVNFIDIVALGLIPGLGRSPGEGNGYPLQYSCLESPKNLAATVHGVAKSWTRLSN